MILYLSEVKDKYIYYGYRNYKDGVANYSGYQNSIATNVGYMDKKEVGDNKPVIPEEYIAGYFPTQRRYLEKIKGLVEEAEYIIILGTGELSYYLQFGESFGGLKDSQFDDLDTIAMIKDKSIKTAPDVTSNKLDTEIYELYLKEEEEWVFTDKKYWDRPVKKPMFLTGGKLVYFPNLDSLGTRKLYLCTNIKENDEIGKQVESTNYTVMLGDEIPEVTALVNPLDLKHAQPVVINTSNLFNKNTMRLMRYGSVQVHRTYGAIEVVAPGNVVIAMLFTMPGLMMILRDEIRMMLNVFEESPRKDITDLIYKGKMIRPELDNKIGLPIEVDKFKLNIHLSTDTLDRNKLKSIEKKSPKVELLYKIRNKTLQYYTVIEADDEIAISYAPFNNLAFIK